MVTLLCPVCASPLTAQERSYSCPNGHSFDRARSGYVNLLLRGGQGKRHGDDRRMVRARAEFLQKGYYDGLSRAVCACAANYAPQGAVTLVDAGCGEGKYTCDVCAALTAAGHEVSAVGIDISRDALPYAARRSRALTLCVASSAAMPLPDGCADLLLNLFSPFEPREFRRVLRPGGVLLRVYPLARHLWELKERIYGQPYENPPLPLAAEGFSLTEERRVEETILLTEQADVAHLFEMTPYYYKTGREDQAKLDDIDSLRVTLSCGVAVYRAV